MFTQATSSVKPLSLLEFILLMAMITSLGALTIDAVLPALPAMGTALGVENSNSTQIIISIIILGMGLGQLLFGPLTDSWGRKPSLYLGLAIYLAGTLVCMAAHSLELMLVGRLIQGFGLAATRIVCVALVRDMFDGREMAKIMSFIMMVFILVPVLAPAFGQIIINYSSWLMIFVSFLVLGIIGLIWFAIRQPETLNDENRRPISVPALWDSVCEVSGNKAVMFYTISAGLTFGGFLTYVASAQAIFEQVFNIVEQFPLYFALMASPLGVASYANSHLVMKHGMLKMIYIAMYGFIAFSVIMLFVSMSAGGKPAFSLFILLTMPLFFCLGLLFGNLNAIAMQPLGHMAGFGAATVGFISSLISALCSMVIGSYFDGTLMPMSIAFVVLGIAALVAMRVAHLANPDIDD